MSLPYKMPHVRRGDIVDWFQGGVATDDQACPALVIRVYHSSVSLKVVGIDNDTRRESVRHLEDPNVREHERVNDGLWAHRENAAHREATAPKGK